MTRQLGIFPYSADGVEAPNTDGTLSSVPTGRDTDIGPPESLGVPSKNNGEIVKGSIGNTDYIYANVVAHGVLAGDS
jgi:hypothetical protein